MVLDLGKWGLLKSKGGGGIQRDVRETPEPTASTVAVDATVEFDDIDIELGDPPPENTWKDLSGMSVGFSLTEKRKVVILSSIYGEGPQDGAGGYGARIKINGVVKTNSTRWSVWYLKDKIEGNDVVFAGSVPFWAGDQIVNLQYVEELEAGDYVVQIQGSSDVDAGQTYPRLRSAGLIVLGTE